MKYCSTCGSDKLTRTIPHQDHKERIVCGNCNAIHYQNPLVVVGCIVKHKDGVLLAKRGIEPRKHYWNLPCGFLELGETVEFGAAREVLEETGIEVEIEELQTVYNVPEYGQVYLIFTAKALNSNYQLTPESTEIGFFKEEQIPWNEIAFTANTFALKNYFKDKGHSSKNVHLGGLEKKD